MNRVFKVVFNRERGKSMVVNEVTRSHQVGKKAAITVAVVGALMGSNAFANDFVSDQTVSNSPIAALNVVVTSKDSNALNFTDKNSVIDIKAEQNITLDAKANGVQLQTESDKLSSLVAGGALAIKAGGVGIHNTVLGKAADGGSLQVKAKSIDIQASGGIFNSSANGKLDVTAEENLNVATNGRLGVSVGNATASSTLIAKNIVINHNATTGVGKIGTFPGDDSRRIAVQSYGNLAMQADRIDVSASTQDQAMYGVLSWGKDGKTNMDAKDINIDVSSDKYARAVRAEGGAQLTLGNADKNSIINVHAKGKDSSEQASIGLHVRNLKSNLTVNGSQLFVTSETATGSAYGVIAQGVETNAAEGDFPVLNLNSKNTVITAKSGTAGGASGLLAMSNSKVNATGNLKIIADDAIVARGDSIININTSGKNAVQLDGDINFNYDKETSGTKIDADVNLNLTNADSYLIGNIIRTVKDAPTDKVYVHGMNLKLANGGAWTNTADSFANKLTLDGGVVNINLADKQAHKVYVNELAGTHGTLNVEVNKTEKDFVHGSLVIDPEYARDPEADAATLLAAAAMPSLDVNLTGITADDITAEQFKEVSKDIVLEATGESTTKPTDKVETTTTVAEGDYNGAMSVVSKNGKTENVVVAEASSLMKDSLALASAGTLSLNRILMNDVRKRLGDIRVAGDMDGAWARYDGGKLSGDDGLENKFHTIQLGYDMALSNGPRVGMAASYTKGDTEYKRGDADMNAYSLAAYSVWMADNGMFADVIARVAKAENDMKVDGSRKGSLDSMAYSVSGEFGWRFDLTDMVYVEPQVEATYTYIDSDSMKLGSSRFDFDNVDSLMGRAGFAAGFKCPADKGDVYVRVSAVHEFLGDAAITGGNGKVFEVDGKDTWVEYGIGANFNVNKNTYVYADLERTSGATLDEDWRANVGVRYNF